MSKPIVKSLITDKEKTNFYRHVRREEGYGDCLIWQGCKLKNGYGRFGYRGDSINPQRMAYAIRYGLCGYEVLGSSCGNKLCCNPNHLYDKSNSDRWTT